MNKTKNYFLEPEIYNRLIAEFYGLKFGYYETFEDNSTGDDLNYKWNKVIYPIVYKDVLPEDKNSDYYLDAHSYGSHYKYFEGYKPELSYKHLIPFHSDWDSLMTIIYFIENLKVLDVDASSDYEVVIWKGCTSVEYNGEVAGTLKEVYGENRLQTTYNAICWFIEYYNNSLKIN